MLPDTASLATLLTDRFGVEVDASLGEDTDGLYVDVRPVDLHENKGFFVRAILGWRHVRADVRIGNFAGELLGDLGRARPEKRAQFTSLAGLLAEAGGKLAMSVNKLGTDALNTQSWPEDWRSFSLSVESSPMMVDHEDPEKLREAILFWAGNMFGMVVSLLPVEDIQSVDSEEIGGLPEGASVRVEVNRYERSRINRTLCIARHGTACAVCQFDFFARYGEVGRDFIHVHHVVPVSTLGAGYVIDPGRDLVPVCPNCHAMLHRRNPPYSVSELRSLVLTDSAI